MEELVPQCATLRNRMTAPEMRLNGLAMMYIYRNLHIKVNSVIDEFSKSNHRLVL